MGTLACVMDDQPLARALLPNFRGTHAEVVNASILLHAMHADGPRRPRLVAGSAAVGSSFTVHFSDDSPQRPPRRPFHTRPNLVLQRGDIEEDQIGIFGEQGRYFGWIAVDHRSYSACIMAL